MKFHAVAIGALRGIFTQLMPLSPPLSLEPFLSRYEPLDSYCADAMVAFFAVDFLKAMDLVISAFNFAPKKILKTTLAKRMAAI